MSRATPPPFTDPEAVVLLGEVPIGSASASPGPVNRTTFDRWREHRHVVTQVEAFDGTNTTLTGRGPAERLSGMAVTPGFLSLLGVTPIIGRTWSEEHPESDVVVVSESFWRVALEMSDRRAPSALRTARSRRWAQLDAQGATSLTRSSW